MRSDAGDKTIAIHDVKQAITIAVQGTIDALALMRTSDRRARAFRVLARFHRVVALRRKQRRSW